MNTKICTAFVVPTLLLAGAVGAAERTVTLDVENVSCVTCAPIVKRTLSKVSGVSRVIVTENAGAALATVTFDDLRVTPEALAVATTHVGFPSRVREN
ncbi:cation transporter [Methylobacterium isbiliense]|uniref:HMA domain-containing protein n=1 Tax=Methylobacterium isbiliense TaxID=315478 RepID=A0ABQ4SJH0_9HYPH|nr:cation transporter [Methylobacterium isbiliense]MDN3627897.1 mercury transporter [Methylobacterium isbiliense]GJE02704.1 hypothetical protein GMJLKIPL_4653 [Methylobacterium isbiliense]